MPWLGLFCGEVIGVQEEMKLSAFPASLGREVAGGAGTRGRQGAASSLFSSPPHLQWGTQQVERAGSQAVPSSPWGCLLLESLAQRRNCCLLRLSLIYSCAFLSIQSVPCRQVLGTYCVPGSSWRTGIRVDKRAVVSVLVETLALHNEAISIQTPRRESTQRRQKGP